ncbi:hypothetical protein ABE073_21835 [Lederbergia citrisecunda]|uniref:hypothetical protein n=1 Tax=Lederbergia citrisecunda TaxID=2833583 RepID=UPI003D2E8A8D
MTNMSYEEEQWYPKLPEGYSEEATGMHGQGDGWMPGTGMASFGMNDYMTGMAMPNSGMNDWMTGMVMPGWGENQTGMPPIGPPGFPPGQGGPGFPPGQGGPGFPGGGFPGGGFPGGGFPGAGFPGGGFPGAGFPPGQGGQGGQQAPSSPPPNFTPSYPGGNQAQLFAVDPGAIRGCLFRYTFVWTSRRNGFWYFPTFVGRTSVAGYRWRPSRRRWEFFGIDLNRIDQFTCF